MPVPDSTDSIAKASMASPYLVLEGTLAELVLTVERADPSFSGRWRSAARAAVAGAIEDWVTAKESRDPWHLSS